MKNTKGFSDSSNKYKFTAHRHHVLTRLPSFTIKIYFKYENKNGTITIA